jgi:hypothetical protein
MKKEKLSNSRIRVLRAARNELFQDFAEAIVLA